MQIDSGDFDKPLHKKRMAVQLIDCGGVKMFGFVGGYKHEAPHTSRLQPHKRPVLEEYPAELYGVPENKYNYF